MLSKNKISLIRSLDSKRGREKTGLFIAEGEKICLELMNSHYRVHSLFYTLEWLQLNRKVLDLADPGMERIELTSGELKKISLLSTPNQVLALVFQQQKSFSLEELSRGPALLLDQIQDPGNLGTIIRTADWFGFRQLVVSPGTVDWYHPKVIQASMGSVFRVHCWKKDLPEVLLENRNSHHRPVLACMLNGNNIFKETLPENGFYLFGNEAVGVSSGLKSLSDRLITIPAQPAEADMQPADSLNVAVAAAIVMAECCRQNSL